MSGRLVSIAILLCAVVAGAALYYLQVFAFYDDVPDQGDAVALATADGGQVVLNYAGFEAIDAASSPIRYRACFRAEAVDLADFVSIPDAVPRNAPGWFDCFDAEAIADALADGTARAFLGQKNIAFGVDRIIVLTRDGRGFVWHDLNDCGEKAYDGTVVGEACPQRETDQ